jgi:DNA-directed RNA polymerase subunit L
MRRVHAPGAPQPAAQPGVRGVPIASNASRAGFALQPAPTTPPTAALHRDRSAAQPGESPSSASPSHQPPARLVPAAAATATSRRAAARPASVSGGEDNSPSPESGCSRMSSAACSMPHDAADAGDEAAAEDEALPSSASDVVSGMQPAEARLPARELERQCRARGVPASMAPSGGVAAQAAPHRLLASRALFAVFLFPGAAPHISFSHSKTEGHKLVPLSQTAAPPSLPMAAPGGAAGGSSGAGTEATFALAGEDHTLGNAVRYMLNKHPGVAFAGYSVPHPSDDVVNIRVQTTGGLTATQALRDAVSGACGARTRGRRCATRARRVRANPRGGQPGRGC